LRFYQKQSKKCYKKFEFHKKGGLFMKLKLFITFFALFLARGLLGAKATTYFSGNRKYTFPFTLQITNITDKQIEATTDEGEKITFKPTKNFCSKVKHYSEPNIFLEEAKLTRIGAHSHKGKVKVYAIQIAIGSNKKNYKSVN
jgi:hypothetical protein